MPPSYDVLESKESYLGTEIRTRVPDEAYKSGWDAIWGKDKKPESPTEELEQK
jgi:hypothetical protein